MALEFNTGRAPPTPEKIEDSEDTIVRDAIDSVLKERKYQKERWSASRDVGHTPQDWASIMGVWMGKVMMTVPPYAGQDDASTKAFRKRVTQLAAICVSALERTEE